MTQAVIYARFSPRPNAEECDSVEKQLERCRSYCKAHGYDVIAEQDDEDMSGGRADNRPGLQAAIALACKAKAVLVVYKLDRLARNTRDALDVLERLQRSKADLASLVEQINSRSPMGKFFFTQVAAFAETGARADQGADQRRHARLPGGRPADDARRPLPVRPATRPGRPLADDRPSRGAGRAGADAAASR
jgi:DNA invertase Pin-like site-specific DNA recombinase